MSRYNPFSKIKNAFKSYNNEKEEIKEPIENSSNRYPNNYHQLNKHEYIPDQAMSYMHSLSSNPQAKFDPSLLNDNSKAFYLQEDHQESDHKYRNKIKSISSKLKGKQPSNTSKVNNLQAPIQAQSQANSYQVQNQSRHRFDPNFSEQKIDSGRKIPFDSNKSSQQNPLQIQEIVQNQQSGPLVEKDWTSFVHTKNIVKIFFISLHLNFSFRNLNMMTMSH